MAPCRLLCSAPCYHSISSLLSLFPSHNLERKGQREKERERKNEEERNSFLLRSFFFIPVMFSSLKYCAAISQCTLIELTIDSIRTWSYEGDTGTEGEGGVGEKERRRESLTIIFPSLLRRKIRMKKRFKSLSSMTINRLFNSLKKKWRL